MLNVKEIRLHQSNSDEAKEQEDKRGNNIECANDDIPEIAGKHIGKGPSNHKK